MADAGLLWSPAQRDRLLVHGRAGISVFAAPGRIPLQSLPRSARPR